MNDNAAIATEFGLGTDGPTTILVGIDGSSASWRALHFAVGLARRQGSKILAIYANRTTIAAHLAMPIPGPIVPHLVGDLGPEVPLALRALGREHCVDITFKSVEGDPVNVLTKAASDHHADLIVVGASEKASHRLFGSTALRTVRSRHCPVAVVP